MNDPDIVYAIRGALHVYPPCVAQILKLADLGLSVAVVAGSCDPSVMGLLADRDIAINLVGDHRRTPGLLGKVEGFAHFAHKGWQEIRRYLGAGTVIWCGTADTAIAIRHHLRRRRYVLSVLELYDQYPFYLRNLRTLAPMAEAVVVPELHRAWILKSWWGLTRLPVVVPNCTYAHPQSRGLSGSAADTDSSIRMLRDKTTVFYQGLITADRDLSAVAAALAESGSDCWLTLMGPDHGGAVDRLKEIYPQTQYVGYVPAPRHLEVTSHATVGVAYYEPSNLNNVFCAPNKIYEYAGFGVPVLCNDVPGLSETIGAAGAGICVDFSDTGAIARAVETLVLEHDAYSQRASFFFEGARNNDAFQDLVLRMGLG